MTGRSDAADGEDADDRLTPAQAFDVLSSEERVRILRTVGSYGADLAPEAVPYPPLADEDWGITYSALKDRVDVRDNGRFNYHLDKLVDVFLVKHGDRYQLSWLGIFVYELLAGTLVDGLDEAPAARRFETDATCPDCGDGLVATHGEDRYEADHLFFVWCPTCERAYNMTKLPPNGVRERDTDGLLDLVDARTRARLGHLARNLCHVCGGIHDTCLLTPDAHDYVARSHTQPVVTHRCRSCGGLQFLNVGELVVPHPALAAFYHEHGRSVADRYVWELPVANHPDRVTVRERDPPEVAVTARLDGDERTFVLGPDLTVVETRDG